MTELSLHADSPRHDAASLDTPRQDATRHYSLTLDEVASRFEQAGLPRSLRMLQRWCASGRLDGLKTDTVDGERYFVDPHSVDRAIVELKQLSALTHRVGQEADDTARPDATGRGLSQAASIVSLGDLDADGIRHDAPRPDMSQNVAPGSRGAQTDAPRQAPPAEPAPTRHDATEIAFMTRYVERIESENVFLREQVDRKDQQIASLLERDKETNFLVRGLQTMLSPLLGHKPQPNDRETSFGHMQ